MSDFFNLKIYTPEEILFDGTVEYLSATNSSGEFGILPGHTLFSSDITAGDHIAQKNEESNNLKK